MAGTNLPIGLRIIEINDFRIDLNLEGKFLVISYQDKPGVIGKVGSILGQDNVNIASMQVGRKSYGGQAIMIIQTDNKPSKATMEKINKNIELTDLTYLEI